VARRRRPDSGAQGEGGGREERGKREEEVGIRFPYLARAGVEQGGGATRAGGGGHGGSRWRRCGQWEGAGGGGRSRGSESDAEVPFYRQGEVVARWWRGGAGGGGRRAARRALMAFGRVRSSRSSVRAARPA